MVKENILWSFLFFCKHTNQLTGDPPSLMILKIIIFRRFTCKYHHKRCERFTTEAYDIHIFVYIPHLAGTDFTNIGSQNYCFIWGSSNLGLHRERDLGQLCSWILLCCVAEAWEVNEDNIRLTQDNQVHHENYRFCFLFVWSFEGCYLKSEILPEFSIVYLSCLLFTYTSLYFIMYWALFMKIYFANLKCIV